MMLLPWDTKPVQHIACFKTNMMRAYPFPKTVVRFIIPKIHTCLGNKIIDKIIDSRVP